MTFPIPSSLQEYYGNQAVRNAVDALVDVLDGADMPEVGWDEARNYNQALLMAAQVRADLADLLFRVWDATFGQADPARLGEEYFNWEEASPAAIWRERYVERYYYRDDRPADEDGRSDGLFVWLVPPTKRTIALGVDRFAEGDDLAELPANATDGLEGWHIAMNDGCSYLSNQSVEIAQFLANPSQTLEQFHRDAVEMVNFLAQN